MLVIIILILIFLILFVSYFIIYARWNYGKLNGLGIPIIKPSFMMGSVPDIHKKIHHFEDIKRSKTYGSVWGMYQGRTPIIYIADPKLIREIFVKYSNHFFNREPFDFGHSILNQILDFLPGDKWKTMRVSQTRLFSSGKIKQYSNEIFSECIMDFMTRLDEDIKLQHDDRLKIDTRSRFCQFTIDAIGRSMFSMKVEPNNNNKFYNACQKLIGEGQKISSFYIWTLIFPFLSKFEPSWILDDGMTDTFKSLLSYRQTDDRKFDDYGDIMKDCMNKMSTQEYKNLGITETTIMGQAVNLVLAGFDRISTIMTFLAYHIANDENVQTKLYEEIDDAINNKHDGIINYDTFIDTPYLNACINETLRLYPIFFRPERVCNKDWECVEKGIKIPKGITVMIPSWALNRNPEIYENPNDFIPERFMPENKYKLNPYAFSTFGFGHRNCIGTRFTYEALKISMCNILNNYKFEIRSDTQIKFKPGVLLILQYYPVYLDVIKRNK